MSIEKIEDIRISFAVSPVEDYRVEIRYFNAQQEEQSISLSKDAAIRLREYLNEKIQDSGLVFLQRLP